VTTNDFQKMVQECLKDDSDRLSAWEVEFLDSIVRQSYFTAKQEAVIQRIWDKLFS
jgi:hypothetical protein